jgi:hypothetical protein
MILILQHREFDDARLATNQKALIEASRMNEGDGAMRSSDLKLQIRQSLPKTVEP